MNSPSDDLSRITVSIVVHNSDLALLQRSLDSLAMAASELAAPVRVVLVDNASEAAYRGALKELVARMQPLESLRLELVESALNLGYGGGHNLALPGSGSCHLIMNPDVELAPDALAVGLERLSADPGIALLSPRATGPDGEQEYLCKRHPSVLVLLLRAFAPGLGRRLVPQRMAAYQMSDVCGPDREVEAPLASGCFMLLRGEMLRAVGGFDERYFLYFEDFDLSRRLADLGRVLYLPGMRIVHHGGYAGRKGLRHVMLFIRNGVRFFSQYGWRWF